MENSEGRKGRPFKDSAGTSISLPRHLLDYARNNHISLSAICQEYLEKSMNSLDSPFVQLIKQEKVIQLLTNQREDLQKQLDEARGIKK